MLYFNLGVICMSYFNLGVILYVVFQFRCNFVCYFRLVSDENGVVVYHNLGNSRTYHELEPQYIELTSEVRKLRHFVLLMVEFE